MSAKLKIELRESSIRPGSYDLDISLEDAQKFAENGVKSPDSVIITLLVMAAGLVIARKAQSVEEANYLVSTFNTQLFDRVVKSYTLLHGVEETVTEVQEAIFEMAGMLTGEADPECESCMNEDCPLAGKDDKDTVH